MCDTFVKKCKRCNIEKIISCFYKHKGMKDGYLSFCKECKKEDSSKYCANNKDKYKKYYADPEARVRKIKIKRQWNKDNEEHNAQYRKDTKLHRNKQRRERYKNDIEYRILSLLRRRLYAALKGTCKSVSTEELLGCTVRELKTHIESLFKKGMGWCNQGQWELDHVMPCVSFDLIDVAQQRECFNYKNLQPLWAEDNRRKSGSEKF